MHQQGQKFFRFWSLCENICDQILCVHDLGDHKIKDKKQLRGGYGYFILIVVWNGVLERRLITLIFGGIYVINFKGVDVMLV